MGYRTAQVSASMGALSWKGTDIGASSRSALREKSPRPLVLGSKCAAGRGSESGNGAYSPTGFQDRIAESTNRGRTKQSPRPPQPKESRPPIHRGHAYVVARNISVTDRISCSGVGRAS